MRWLSSGLEPAYGSRLAVTDDAIVVLGAAMSLHVNPPLEKKFGKPALTTMSVDIWNDLMRPGLILSVYGWGRPLASRGVL